MDGKGFAENHGRNARPQNQQHGKNRQHDFLAAVHRSLLLQAVFGKLRRVGGFLDFGRINEIQHQRHQEHCHQARQQHRQSPSAPAQMNLAVGGFGYQIDHQRIGCGGGDEHRRSNRIAVVVHQSQIAADSALRSFFGVGIIAGRNRLHHGVDDAAAARGVAGRDRRENQLRQGQAVADAQRFLAEQRNKIIADARA